MVFKCVAGEHPSLLTGRYFGVLSEELLHNDDDAHSVSIPQLLPGNTDFFVFYSGTNTIFPGKTSTVVGVCPVFVICYSFPAPYKMRK